MPIALKLVLGPLLVVQALRTRARALRLTEAAGERAGEIGSGPSLRLLVAGDSSAAGVGVSHQREALAAPLAGELARLASVRVHWRLEAASGLSTAALLARLREGPPPQAEMALVVTGVNDVVEQVGVRRAVQARQALANWLRNAAGVRHVAFAPVPPIGRFPATSSMSRSVGLSVRMPAETGTPSRSSVARRRW